MIALRWQRTKILTDIDRQTSRGAIHRRTKIGILTNGLTRNTRLRCRSWMRHRDIWSSFDIWCSAQILQRINLVLLSLQRHLKLWLQGRQRVSVTLSRFFSRQLIGNLPRFNKCSKPRRFPCILCLRGLRWWLLGLRLGLRLGLGHGFANRCLIKKHIPIRMSTPQSNVTT